MTTSEKCGMVLWLRCKQRADDKLEMPISSWRGGGGHFAHFTPQAQLAARRIRQLFLSSRPSSSRWRAKGQRSGGMAWQGARFHWPAELAERRRPSGAIWMHSHNNGGPPPLPAHIISQRLGGRAKADAAAPPPPIRLDPFASERKETKKWGCSITSLSTTCKVPPQMHLDRNASLSSFSPGIQRSGEAKFYTDDISDARQAPEQSPILPFKSPSCQLPIFRREERRKKG